MTTRGDVEALLKANQVELVSKNDLWWMCALDKLMFWNDKFMATFWTTVVLGPIRVIAYPSGWDTRSEALKRVYTIIHEIEHVRQADVPIFGSRTLGNAWFGIKYALLYFPVLGAYFRLDYEVKAYVKGFRAQIKGEQWTPRKVKLDEWVEWVSTGLWKYYFYTVPKSVTRKRLRSELSDLYSIAI